MSLNNKENKIQVESELNNLNISYNDSNSVIINHEYCYELTRSGELWCKECVPHIIVTEMIEGWTSENNDIDNFIKDTIYYAKNIYYGGKYYPLFLEWVPFDKFTDIKQIGEGGFSKVYSATWIDGKAKYYRHDDGSWKKLDPESMKVALKKLNGSQNISAEYLNEILDYPSNEPKSDDKVYGVLPYIAPEVLNREKYTLPSDIYSFGIIMTDYHLENHPFIKRKHDASLALDICDGLRPEFGKGTPEIYKKLAYRCMNVNPNQRPTANELEDIIKSWHRPTYHYNSYQEDEKFGYKGKEIKAMFEEADKEIPNISTSYKKDPDAIYTSRAFTFSNISKPTNSSIITSYLNDNKDFQLVIDLEVTTSSSQATKEEQEDYHSLEFNFELSNSNKRIIMTNADYHSLEFNFELSNSNKRIIMTNSEDEKEEFNC